MTCRMVAAVQRRMRHDNFSASVACREFGLGREQLGALFSTVVPRRINNLPALEKIIMTGCLRVSRESIFTGFNNSDVNSACSEDKFLADCIGFTQEDVDNLLHDYGLSSRRDVVKDWYDGYRFAGREIYCPWDVINFVQAACDSDDPLTEPPRNLWLNSSGNAVLLPFIDHLTKTDSDMMQTLVDGGTVEVELNEQVTYADLEAHGSEDFWTLLLFSGYLTVVDRKAGGRYGLKIPNEEIRDSFLNRIEHLFSPRNGAFVQEGESIAASIFSGDAAGARTTLLRVLRKYVPVRDTATKAPRENYYHAFLLALLISAETAGSIANLNSNREAGDGFSDILFTSADENVGVVVELKCCDPNRKIPSAREALDQIRQKRYVEGLTDFGCSRCWGVGIAFSGRSCAVLVEELREVPSN